jgi:hypothetical protein
MVVMVFDDARAARDVRRGSRHIGEARFQAALAHQRAMYLKDAARGEHTFTILVYPKEVIHFELKRANVLPRQVERRSVVRGRGSRRIGHRERTEPLTRNGGTQDCREN